MCLCTKVLVFIFLNSIFVLIFKVCIIVKFILLCASLSIAWNLHCLIVTISTSNENLFSVWIYGMNKLLIDWLITVLPKAFHLLLFTHFYMHLITGLSLVILVLCKLKLHQDNQYLWLQSYGHTAYVQDLVCMYKGWAIKSSPCTAT
jgi:hypothetical protein